MTKNPLDVDASETEVDAPFNKWCASGHVAGETYRRSGPDSPAEPTRFFLVQAGDICGIYCEPCLVVANYVSRLKKKGLV
jgi:hypothetical protein